MSIYVIDDHPLMRDAIVMVLRRLRPAENIVELERLDKLASSVAQRGAPTLFCLDLKLPGATTEGSSISPTWIAQSMFSVMKSGRRSCSSHSTSTRGFSRR